MKNCNLTIPLFFLFFFLLSTQTKAQNLVYKNGKYFIGNNFYTYKDIPKNFDMNVHTSQMYSEIRQSKNRINVGSVVLTTGIGFMVWGQLKFKKRDNFFGQIEAVGDGLVLMSVGITITIGGGIFLLHQVSEVNNNRQYFLDSFNSSPIHKKQNNKDKQQLWIGISGNGVGLCLAF